MKQHALRLAGALGQIGKRMEFGFGELNVGRHWMSIETIGFSCSVILILYRLTRRA